MPSSPAKLLLRRTWEGETRLGGRSQVGNRMEGGEGEIEARSGCGGPCECLACI